MSPNYIRYVRECNGHNRCGLCEADCDGDSDCEPGLKCRQRHVFEAVPGCVGEGGAHDRYGKDVCYLPSLYCPINDIIGQTFYVFEAGDCFKVEVFPGGFLEVDFNSNPNSCKESNFHSDGILSLYFMENGNHAEYYPGPLGFSGLIEFKESSSTTTVPTVDIVYYNPSTKVFDLEIILPSCTP